MMSVDHSETSMTGHAYLWNLLRFTVKRHPVILANFALAAASVVLDLIAIGSIMPLTLAAAGKAIPSDSIWTSMWEAVGMRPTLPSYLLFFSLVFALRLITQFVNQATSIKLGKKVQADLSSQAFSKIVDQMSLREIDAKSTGYFISLAGDETARAGTILISLNQLVAAAMLATLYFAAMLYISTLLGLAVIIFLGVVTLALRPTLSRIRNLSSRQLTEAKAAHSVFLDALNGLRSVRALSAELFVISRYSEIIHRYTDNNSRLEILGIASKILPALVLLACISTVAIAGFLDFTESAKIALAVTALACLLRFFPAAGQVLSLFVKILTDLRAASDVTTLLEGPRPVPERSRIIKASRIQRIDFSEVTFSYSPFKPILRNFSAKLEEGKCYAVVGPSGSGKTTIFDLILGFYEPEFGTVLVDGVPLKDLDNKSVRSRIALVNQQTSILNDSIANNIRFGRSATDEDVRKACEAVCIDEYIEGLECGYDTQLSFQGANLSGGQRQRIAIARALLRKPDVLLLDESTTGLDEVVRARVIQNIIRGFSAQILVFSTHDPSVTAQADEIIRIAPVPASDLGRSGVALTGNAH
jgi:ABC-type bacteriocin/lantibiotic exporter with double-glycine peptidase domain